MSPNPDLLLYGLNPNNHMETTLDNINRCVLEQEQYHHHLCLERLHEYILRAYMQFKKKSPRREHAERERVKVRLRAILKAILKAIYPHR